MNSIIVSAIKRAIRENRVDEYSQVTGVSRTRLYQLSNEASPNVTVKTAEKILEVEKHPLLNEIRKYSNAA
ncbi:hypothetical protein [Pseudoalteromonas piratica]|uniref:HTH cro/C1-type domain-containing protein n=1 Tax=Pseudoalteromonas piratica TaxID=1348114 RepID=A0A0A7EGT7_9GAMM|nr:hypothetical protein [Pseudoalteromonas piratica]AIY65177.1 hypothetical protein OM33_08405 [Pseudoalteromonas piratica]